MTTICASLIEEVQLDFFRAYEQLARARCRQAEKDSLVNRSVVAEWLAIINSILELYLDIQATRAG